MTPEIMTVRDHLINRHDPVRVVFVNSYRCLSMLDYFFRKSTVTALVSG
jgi:hypothetical protein